ncbi:translation initiation factor IF-3, mitochondrial [Euwallacea fornicatus]|uniref:translation initiation factor IF-3, mitochondrial n=1 Tax=Euwallacea fornicatus TaxID=995702 RepID=UPI00338E6B77
MMFMRRLFLQFNTTCPPRKIYLQKLLEYSSITCPLNSRTDLNKNPSTLEIKPQTEKPQRKKTSPIPKITLLSGDDISVITVEEAQRIAKRRDMKLVKIIDLDTKSERPVYKLFTGAEYLAEDLKQRERKKSEKLKGPFKGEKMLILSQNISEHDLQTNIKKIAKWLEKKHEVRVVINGNVNNNVKAENIYSLLEKNITSIGRLVQKRQKGTDIKFQILPLKETKQNSEQEENNRKDLSL